MDWTLLIGQATINGLVVGLLYLLMAVGFTLIFGVMRMVNFAHGEFYMIGAFIGYFFTTTLQLPFLVAVLMSFVGATAFGTALEWLILRRFRKDELNGMIVTIGIGLILQNVALIWFGPAPLSMPPVAQGVSRIGGIVIPNSRLYVVGFSIVVLFVLYTFLRFSKLGRGLRAVIEDYETAALMGMRPRFYYPLGFGIGVGLAGMAGALMAPIFSVSPFIGSIPLLKAFIVVILGGLGSIPGAALSGLLLGLLESFSSLLFEASTGELLIFALVIVVLIVMPRGILGKGDI